MAVKVWSCPLPVQLGTAGPGGRVRTQSLRRLSQVPKAVPTLTSAHVISPQWPARDDTPPWPGYTP